MLDIKSRNFDHEGKSIVLSKEAMVISSHPLASSIGIQILKDNGNAVDAALAMNAVLCVAEPHMTGVGGDCFVMLSSNGSNKIKILNGSGKSSKYASSEKLRRKHLNEISFNMPDAITIPGAVAAWSLLHKDYGYMPWKEIFQPAIKYSKLGVNVHERVALDWAENTEKLSVDKDTSNIFLKNGKPLGFTDNFVNQNLSETLSTIANEGPSGFYHGWVAEDMLNKLHAIGGNHTSYDFSNVNAEWIEPISSNYRNIKIFECPPNGQGIVVLIILGILEKFNFNLMSKTDYFHIFCEAVKIAYFLRDKYLADSQFNKLSYDYFLNKKTLEKYASKIDLKKAKFYSESCFPEHPDTIYLTVRDKNGMTISFINSLFDAFGSGITSGKSGVLFHSRGRAFNLIKGHPNELAPNKRPLHTIIPAMISYKENLIGSFGVMGGHYQAAGQAYVLSQMIDFGFNPQSALNFPRVFPNNNYLDIENEFDKDLIDQLVLRGHKINYSSSPIGGGQIMLIDNDKKILIGASDWRKDGCAIGY